MIPVILDLGTLDYVFGDFLIVYFHISFMDAAVSHLLRQHVSVPHSWTPGIMCQVLSQGRCVHFSPTPHTAPRVMCLVLQSSTVSLYRNIQPDKSCE